MTEYRQYDEATKAAVMAALLDGQSVSSVAKEYNIPKGTVSNWKNRGWETPSDVAGVPTNGTQKRNRIGELIIDGLEAKLVAIKAMADVFAEKDWIRKQPASEIAVLFGVVSDKAFRVLEALPEETEESES